MDNIIEVGIRFHNIYKREWLVTIDAVDTAYDTKVTPWWIAQSVVLDRSWPHVYIDVLAYLGTFPSLINPKGLLLLTLHRVTVVVLWVEVELLLTSLRVITLYLLYLSSWFPEYSQYPYITIHVVGEIGGIIVIVKETEWIQYHITSSSIYIDVRNKAIPLIKVIHAVCVGINILIVRSILQSFNILLGELVPVGINDSSRIPIVFKHYHVSILYKVGIARLDYSHLPGVYLLYVGFTSYYVTEVSLFTNSICIHKALVEYLSHIKFLHVMVEEEVTSPLPLVLIFIGEVVCLLLKFLLEVLFTLRAVHQHLLKHCIYLVILLLLYLRHCCRVGYYYPEVKESLGLLASQYLKLRVDNGVVLYVVRNEGCLKTIRIGECLHVTHVYLTIDEVIVDLHGKYRLSCQVVVQKAVVVPKINTSLTKLLPFFTKW